MIPYASNTGTRRNLSALKAAGWRLLLTPDNPTPRDGLRFGIDNGAFGKGGFRPDDFGALVERLGSAADFVILPDIVGGGMESFELSMSWITKLRHLKLLLLPLQDNMIPEKIGQALHHNFRLGLFLGGSTEYKLREMYAWGMVAHAFRRHYHVGRVNTLRRIRLAHEAGADSIDGTSATMYSCTLPMLDSGVRQPSPLTPCNEAQRGATA